MPEGEAPHAESIGERLRRLRRASGLSQRELSEPGISYAYISRIEAGARRPSVKALRKLAPKLGVTVEYLETGSELGEHDALELRLGEAELRLRLDPDAPQAEAEFRALAAESERAGNLDACCRSRLGLGEAAARRGDYALAIDEFEAARATGRLSPLTHADVFATLARAYSACGRPDQAVALLEDCLEEARTQAPKDLAAEVRYTSYLSYALSDLGEHERAREVVRGALAHSQATDAYSRVRLYWSLGRLALIEGKPRLALRQIQRAIGLLEATEDTRQLARAHISCGEILLDDGRPEQAGAHLELAGRILGEHADAADLGWLWSEQARHAIRLGQTQAAVTLAERALSILGDAEPLERARAHAVLAEAKFAQPDSARVDFELALELLEGERRWQEAAVLARLWGEALREAGRGKEALDVLDRAAGYGGQATLAPLVPRQP
ncbi:MAG TPA: helix-turn-helix domain-containing protein [Gaiellaceae bacterium]